MVGGEDHRTLPRDLVDRALDPDPGHARGRSPGAEADRIAAISGGESLRRPASTATAVASCRRAAPASRIAFDDRGDRVLEPVAVGEMIRASGGRPERRDVRLRSSSSRRRSSSRISRASGPSGPEAALLGPPPGPLLDRRVEEDLEVGVGQDDRPDVAAGHDDRRRRRGQVALALEQRRAELRHGRDGRHRLVDGGPVDLVGVSTPSTMTRASRPFSSGTSSISSTSALERRPGRRPRRRVRAASQVTARYSRPVSQKR